MRSTRDRILAEATRQLTEQGYDAFTLANVRAALGLSSGSLFHAFPSKPALAAAVYVEGMAAYQRAAAVAIAKQTPALALRAWIAAHMAWVEDNRDLARYLFSTLPEEVTALAIAPLAERNSAYYTALAALFEGAARAGLAGRLERPLAQALAIGPAQDYCRQWVLGRAKTPPRKLARTFQDAAIAALKATARRPQPKETTR
jgi:AcrR family transcriptional regulator